MNANNLIPGLKQVLEDKRIRRFGVPEAERENYLRGESFVVDCGLTDDEVDDVKETYKDLHELGLAASPCPYFVLHMVSRAEFWAKGKGPDILHSMYVCGENIYHLAESESEWRYLNNRLIKNNNFFISNIQNLIVLLATRGIEKNRKAPPTNRMMTAENKAHKKGCGGYTIIRRPITIATSPEGDAAFTKRPHFRRGHIRKYHPDDKTRWTWVSPCFINGEPEIQRKAYLVA